MDMAKNILEYKGYQSIIEFSAEDMTLFGRVLDIDDKIIFEIENPNDALSVFKEVIDEYLEFCEENDKEPCKPYKGSFNVRVSPDLHKGAVQKARRMGITLNALVEKAIRNEVDKQPSPSVVNIYLSSASEENNHYNSYNYNENSSYQCVKYTNPKLYS